jgi:hypothetical protein
MQQQYQQAKHPNWLLLQVLFYCHGSTESMSWAEAHARPCRPGKNATWCGEEPDDVMVQLRKKRAKSVLIWLQATPDTLALTLAASMQACCCCCC